jgi:hypothetical protein
MLFYSDVNSLFSCGGFIEMIGTILNIIGGIILGFGEAGPRHNWSVTILSIPWG